VDTRIIRFERLYQFTELAVDILKRIWRFATSDSEMGRLGRRHNRDKQQTADFDRPFSLEFGLIITACTSITTVHDFDRKSIDSARRL
jgi:hypothetical protein